jgi:holo-[acyl-carrier protein] synthase
MITGTGIDVEEVSRFQMLMAKHSSLGHIFGPDELQMLAAKASPASYAANFCAKEAFGKALGTGIRGFCLNEVQLLRDASGRPYYRLSGNAATIVQRNKLVFHVSVTHSGGFAAAFTVAERDECL